MPLFTKVTIEDNEYCDGCWTYHKDDKQPTVVFQPSLSEFDPEREDVILCEDCLEQMLAKLKAHKAQK